MRIKAGNQMSEDAEVLDFGAGASLVQTDGDVAVTLTAAAVTGQVEIAQTQVAHGFTVGDLIRATAAGWVLSQADSGADGDVDAIVSAVADANDFTATLSGYVPGLSGLVEGADYFLDAATAGAFTATEPTTAGQISEPVLKAVSATEAIFRPLRGLQQPDPATLTWKVKVKDDTTALTVGEDLYVDVITSDLDGWSLTDVIATVTTAPTVSVPSIGVRKNAATEMLSTDVTIDVGELTSETAATAAVVKSDGSQTVATGDTIHIDCDSAGGTNAKGLTVTLVFTSS